MVRVRIRRSLRVWCRVRVGVRVRIETSAVPMVRYKSATDRDLPLGHSYIWELGVRFRVHIDTTQGDRNDLGDGLCTSCDTLSTGRTNVQT